MRRATHVVQVYFQLQYNSLKTISAMSKLQTVWLHLQNWIIVFDYAFNGKFA
jgi:hypothetical protein